MSTERDGNVLYQQKESDDQFVDWRGREANPKKNGGIRAAALTCGTSSQSHLTLDLSLNFCELH